jgi:hypothetical protein
LRFINAFVAPSPYDQQERRGDKQNLQHGTQVHATDIATPAPVHKVRYAAMHIGHFGSRISRVPEPTHPPLVLLRGGDTIETSVGHVLPKCARDRIDRMTLMSRSEWLVPMVGDFLDAPMPKTQ